MPIWCPNCNAMLPEGTQECPRCGHKLGGALPEAEEEVNRKDIFWYSAFTIGILLIMIIIVVAIGLICVLALTSN
jgi:uncharacterized membrane protein YvbJ